MGLTIGRCLDDGPHSVIGQRRRGAEFRLPADIPIHAVQSDSVRLGTPRVYLLSHMGYAASSKNDSVTGTPSEKDFVDDDETKQRAHLGGSIVSFGFESGEEIPRGRGGSASRKGRRRGDLYSIVEFVDDRRLGPAFQFFNRHRVVDEKGKVLGFERLDELREKLAPIFLRRTRASVLQDLPPRTTNVVRISPTAEQKELHDGHRLTVQTIINKPYLTEMDMLRLQKALLMCRLVADSTSLVDAKGKKGYSSKLERLEEILTALGEEGERKIVIFSEWTKMLDLIEPLLERAGMGYVRLDGSVPQKKRQVLVNRFQRDPDTKVFITTNAGSTGLNLQAADTVINVDLPWNPAVLEQRIGRAHRMGQKRPVQVYLLVTEETLEENLLVTLSAKHQLALAALDMESDVDAVEIQSGMEELKRRLELLLGAEPEAPSDEIARERAEAEAAVLTERKERVSRAGGALLQSAFAFLGELLPEAPETDATRAMKAQLKAGLEACVEKDPQGRPQLTVTLPSPDVLETFAEALSRMVPHA